MANASTSKPGRTKRILRASGRPTADAEFDTREAILKATHELLLEKGGLQVSISQICQRAGVNVAMVHYHFGNKTGLLITLFESMCAKWSGELEHLLELPVSPRTKLERHVTQIIRNYRMYPYNTRLMSMVVSACKGPQARRLSNNFMRPLTEFYRKLIDEGVEAGEFRRVDPEFFFFSVVGACEFFFSAKQLLGPIFRERKVDEQIEAEFGQHTVSLLLDGMSAVADS